MEKEITLKEAIKVLTKHLKEDSDYRESWKANIAVRILDELYYPLGSGQTTQLSRQIANCAADNFLNALCNETENEILNGIKQ